MTGPPDARGSGAGRRAAEQAGQADYALGKRIGLRRNPAGIPLLAPIPQSSAT